MREEENKIHQMKLKFFTDVSHELKTPLALIYSPIEELINEPGLEPLVARKLMFVRRNIGRLLNLANVPDNLPSKCVAIHSSAYFSVHH